VLPSNKGVLRVLITKDQDLIEGERGYCAPINAKQHNHFVSADTPGYYPPGGEEMLKHHTYSNGMQLKSIYSPTMLVQVEKLLVRKSDPIIPQQQEWNFPIIFQWRVKQQPTKHSIHANRLLSNVLKNAWNVTPFTTPMAYSIPSDEGLYKSVGNAWTTEMSGIWTKFVDCMRASPLGNKIAVKPWTNEEVIKQKRSRWQRRKWQDSRHYH